MLRAGLTGGISTGKSTVAQMLEEMGCQVLRLDEMAHELMAPGQPAYREIVAAFGKEILATDDTIDRKQLARLVFADRAKLAQLNAIVHPRVIERTEAQLAEIARTTPDAIVVVEAALLVESGYHRRLDKLIVTWCRPEQQRERLLARTGLSRAEAEQRLAAQLPQEEKRRQADYQIDCSGSLDDTRTQVHSVVEQLRRQVRPAAKSRA
ncbi:MAG: dephospho-CoA kinase [Acidobacteria bacterium]|nr:dephospho-CoA kinase [Acidobacteriota bacterium]